jgi:hypothetical protein
MSSIAVFLVLGGATAFAAGLAKNSVGSKQIKKNAVTSAKIKNNAVTTGKIKNGAVTGSKLNLGSIGTVPSAANAGHATSANNADNANNANTVGGNSVRRIFYSSNETAASQTILSLDGLTLTASCPTGEVEASASTSVNDSLIHSGGEWGGSLETFYRENDDFEIGENFDFLADSTTGSDSVNGTLTYAQPGGAVVSVVFQAEEGAFSGFATDCLISGYAIG